MKNILLIIPQATLGGVKTLVSKMYLALKKENLNVTCRTSTRPYTPSILLNYHLDDILRYVKIADLRYDAILYFGSTTGLGHTIDKLRKVPIDIFVSGHPVYELVATLNDPDFFIRTKLGGLILLSYNKPIYLVNSANLWVSHTLTACEENGIINHGNYVKGFHVLLEALRKLSKQGVKAEFILTNTYNSLALKELRRLEEGYGGLRIYVVGGVGYKILTNLHGQAWALIFPSIWEEPLPYAVAEAATLGTLPVSSKVGGGCRAIERDTAESRFMFTPSKSYELAEKLRYLCLLSTSEVKAVGYKLRGEVLRRLDQREVEKKILKVFTSIAESRDE